jgi:hypothetical protein
MYLQLTVNNDMKIIFLILLLACNTVYAAKFVHNQNSDPMTDRTTGSYSTVKSEDKQAELYIEWHGKKGIGAWIDLKKGLFHNNDKPFRYKFGKNAVQDNLYSVEVNNSGYKSLQLGGAGLETGEFADRILRHTGELRIEVEVFNVGPRVFIFKIEQDATTRSR